MTSTSINKSNKKKPEWSKIVTGLIIVFFASYGIWCGVEYYNLCRIAIENDVSMPDSTLAVTCVSMVLASILSYCLYQFGLKANRNKYGIDADGQPFREKIEFDEIPEQEIEDNEKE